ncbi:MAG: sigma-54 dependent transcriptional regulator [Pseudomonadota bacterium]
MTNPRVLVVDDELDIRSLIQEILSEEGYDVTVAADASEAQEARAKMEPDLVLLDIWMPDTDGITLLREWSSESATLCPVVMMSGHGTVDTAVEATRLGAVDFIEKPLSLAKLLRTVEKALQGAQSRPRPDPSRLLLSAVKPVGRSSAMRQLREHAKQVAQHTANVLIAGETGSGRESIARFIHDESVGGSSQPFISVSGGLLTDDTAAQQLFGVDADSPGLLEQAVGGTLFVSELSDLGAHAQNLLASALEHGRFQRPGDNAECKVTARVIASVRPDYELLASDDVLRRDLLSSINVLGLKVPALRDYAEDVPELLRYYVDLLVDAEGLPFRRFGVAAQNRLRNYPWPNNVRGLRNLVQRCLMAGGDEEVSLDEIEAELATAAAPVEPLVKQDLLALPLREAREQFERAYLTEQLILCDGKVGQLSKRVGMERTHLYRKLRSLGVDFRQTQGGDE